MQFGRKRREHEYLALAYEQVSWIMCTKGICGWVSINTFYRHLHRPSIDSRLTNFRRYAVKCWSILAVITHSVLVNTQQTCQSLPYGRCQWPVSSMSVACWWYISVVNHKNTTVSHPKHTLLCYQNCLGTFWKFLQHLLMIPKSLG